jgi:hypothetical protein
MFQARWESHDSTQFRIAAAPRVDFWNPRAMLPTAGGKLPRQGAHTLKRRRYWPGSSCGWEPGWVCALAFPATLGRWSGVHNFQIRGFVRHQRRHAPIPSSLSINASGRPAISRWWAKLKSCRRRHVLKSLATGAAARQLSYAPLRSRFRFWRRWFRFRWRLGF